MSSLTLRARQVAVGLVGSVLAGGCSGPSVAPGAGDPTLKGVSDYLAEHGTVTSYGNSVVDATTVLSIDSHGMRIGKDIHNVNAFKGGNSKSEYGFSWPAVGRGAMDVRKDGCFLIFPLKPEGTLRFQDPSAGFWRHGSSADVGFEFGTRKQAEQFYTLFSKAAIAHGAVGAKEPLMVVDDRFRLPMSKTQRATQAKSPNRQVSSGDIDRLYPRE